ncbi:MAG: hypothetical protein LAT64_13420 [Phycisphaerales bacterium]|nr:hypothetical protein [Planctomycetota bacterium]MCH8509755.1 hypothetical protein [Phycisphaerales bacterium]
MACGTGICAGKVIAIVVGLGAAGFLGFNWVTTGCPTGVCPTERAAQAAITPASLNTEKAEGCCELMAEAACEAEKVCCSEKACDTEKVCCSEKACDAEKACGEAKACAGQSACGSDEAQITNVAMTTEAATCCFEKGAKEPCDETKPCCKENFGLADKSAQP